MTEQHYCELCGARVRVAGRTTLHYEPVDGAERVGALVAAGAQMREVLVAVESYLERADGPIYMLWNYGYICGADTSARGWGETLALVQDNAVPIAALQIRPGVYPVLNLYRRVHTVLANPLAAKAPEWGQ